MNKRCLSIVSSWTGCYNIDQEAFQPKEDSDLLNNFLKLFKNYFVKVIFCF